MENKVESNFFAPSGHALRLETLLNNKAVTVIEKENHFLITMHGANVNKSQLKSLLFSELGIGSGISLDDIKEEKKSKMESSCKVKFDKSDALILLLAQEQLKKASFHGLPRIETIIAVKSITAVSDRQQYFKEILCYLEKGIFDGKDIKAKLLEMETRIPNLSQLDEQHYLSESYRLLTSLGHMTSLDGEMDALLGLLPVFTTPCLQKIADLYLGQILCTQRFEVNHFKQQQAFYQLGLYSLRNHLHKPEFLAMAWIAFFKLLDPEGIFTHGLKRDLENEVALLNYNALINIAREALDLCEAELHTPLAEIELLQTLITQKKYHPLNVTFLFQSPAFCIQFKKYHADKYFITLPEHCLWAGSDMDFRIPISYPKMPVNEKQRATCYIEEKNSLFHEPLIESLAEIRKRISKAIEHLTHSPVPESKMKKRKTAGENQEKESDQPDKGLSDQKKTIEPMLERLEHFPEELPYSPAFFSKNQSFQSNDPDSYIQSTDFTGDLYFLNP